MSIGEPRTVNLDLQSLDKVIAVLTNAMKDYKLSLSERISYRGLMLSADFAIAHFVITYVFLASSIYWSIKSEVATISDSVLFVVGSLALLSGLTLGLSLLIGIPSLLFSINLIHKTFVERKKLRLLGVAELTKSLWKESRRSRWLSRFRSGFLVFIGVYMFLGIIFTSISVKVLLLDSVLSSQIQPILSPLEIIDFGRILVAVAAWLAMMLFSARYLRNQREQMDLAADAVQLRSIFMEMLQQASAKGIVKVPVEFVEQAASIESTQIANSRKTAILKSTNIRSSGYAIVFDNSAAQQRLTLEVADRIELQDLEAKLSTEDIESLFPLRPSSQSMEQMLQIQTKSGRVEIEFVINYENRIIRVVTVKSLIGDNICKLAGEDCD